MVTKSKKLSNRGLTTGCTVFLSQATYDYEEHFLSILGVNTSHKKANLRELYIRVADVKSHLVNISCRVRNAVCPLRPP